MIELHPRNEAFYFGLEGQEKKITVAITIDWSKKIIFVSLNRNSFEIMKSFLILNKVFETDLKGAWGEKWEVDIICVKSLLGNNPWIYSFFYQTIRRSTVEGQIFLQQPLSSSSEIWRKEKEAIAQYEKIGLKFGRFLVFGFLFLNFHLIL